MNMIMNNCFKIIIVFCSEAEKELGQNFFIKESLMGFKNGVIRLRNVKRKIIIDGWDE